MRRKTRIKVYQVAFSAKEKMFALRLLKRQSIEFVAHRYHCSVRSIYRWRKLFDGTIESLSPKYCAPHTPHPSAHQEEEIKNIYNLIRRNPGIGLNELYGKLITNYSYSRHPASLYRFLRKRGFYLQRPKIKVYKPQIYDTPLNAGAKMQVDVKVVPRNCYVGEYREERRFFQYTAIDEATRQRFIYPYQEQNVDSTIDFIFRAIKFFGYKPKIIQTDNGQEFTFIQPPADGRLHTFDKVCQKLGIVHQLIKPRTPRHNGKVERSHRNDNQRFYKNLRFYSYQDLVIQMTAYLKRSNNIPISILRSTDNKKGWLSPNQKRAELFSLGMIA